MTAKSLINLWVGDIDFLNAHGMQTGLIDLYRDCAATMRRIPVRL